MIPTLSFSQTTFPNMTKDSLIVITPLQLKKTNLIFIEHAYLKNKTKTLEELINLKDLYITESKKIENAQKNQLQINNLALNKVQKENSEIKENLQKQIHRKRIYRKCLFAGLSVSLITFIFIR